MLVGLFVFLGIGGLLYTVGCWIEWRQKARRTWRAMNEDGRFEPMLGEREEGDNEGDKRYLI